MNNIRSNQSANSRKVLGDISNSTENNEIVTGKGKKKASVHFLVKDDKGAAAAASARRRQAPRGRGAAASNGSRVLKKGRVAAPSSRGTLTVDTALLPSASISYQFSAPADDIDSRDSDDVLFVTEYVEDMYEHFRENEVKKAVKPDYMDQRFHINEKMRSILVDWLVEVHRKYKLVPETLYLTVALVDRFLERAVVTRPKLQLVGVACVLIASKYEEIYPTEVRELVYICDRAYTKDQIIEMEKTVLEALTYQVTIASPHAFLVRYLKAAHADKKIVQTACYILDGTLQSYDLLRYLPSQLAAAAVWIARKQSGRNAWSPTLLKYAGYSEEEVAPVAQDVLYQKTTAAPQLRSVDKKYSSAKFGGVSHTSFAGL